MGKLVAFVLLLPFRLIFWGGLGILLCMYLEQEGYMEYEPTLNEVRRYKHYELCLARAPHEIPFESDEAMKRYCSRRFITNSLDY